MTIEEDSTIPATENDPLPAWQRELIDERRRAYEENPDDVLSWEEIEANAQAAITARRREGAHPLRPTPPPPNPPEHP